MLAAAASHVGLRRPAGAIPRATGPSAILSVAAVETGPKMARLVVLRSGGLAGL